MHLSRLQHLQIDFCPLQDMPCIEALTALRNLHLDVTDYTQENRTFMSRLDEQTLVMIADEVLGGWGLLREWRQPEGAGAGGGSC